jgi:hypothetical protein
MSSEASPPDRPDKAPRTAAELEALVLAELQALPECEGAVHVTVVPYDDVRAASNWQVASFDRGSSEWGSCEQALCTIVHDLQQRFEINRSR